MTLEYHTGRSQFTFLCHFVMLVEMKAMTRSMGKLIVVDYYIITLVYIADVIFYTLVYFVDVIVYILDWTDALMAQNRSGKNGNF